MKFKKIKSEHEEAEFYRRKFEELTNSGVTKFYTKNKSKYITICDGEQFKQCWEDTPERKTFPKRWFVSDEHLLSVYNKRIIYVPKNYREDGRPCYKYTYYDENGKITNKTIEAHNLVWLTWEVPAFGKAKQLLEEKGVYAIGVSSQSEDVVQGHHKNDDKHDNRPTNGKFVTDKTHTLLTHAPEFNGDSNKEEKWVVNFSKVMSEENPKSPTILFTGQHGDTVENLTFDGGVSDVIALDSTLDKETSDKLKRMQFLVVDAYFVTH